MIKIELPDGSIKEVEAGISGFELANQISHNLAKAALAVEIDGTLKDLTTPLTTNAKVKIITAKDKHGLEILRHSCSHVMSEAVKELWPDVQVTIGPFIEDGFYYDFSRKEPFTTEDFAKIEEKMHEIVKRDEKITREVVSREDAVALFKSRGEHYKVEIIEDLPADAEISLYRQGDYVDLCRGPHVPSTGHIGNAFKLMKVAGAYWRGDSNNEMLQRIYATAWADKKALNAYLQRLEEAAKRDHRKIGKQLDLYHMQEEAPGMVFWHNDGWTIFRELEVFVRSKLKEYQYQEVKGPFMMDRVLWEKTGHWDNYKDAMFTTSSENREYCIKPMNCPGHVQIFNQGLKSYRDLPLRMAEFGSCHRNEPSGSLHGLMRVRGFTQDDAHIFCTEEQIRDEVNGCIRLVYDMYSTFGFEKIVVKLSTRPEKRIGSDEMWDRAEADLAVALEENNIPFEYQLGEGAFYGPKIEFTLYDCLDRAWQCGTVQLDFSLPSRLSASYVGEDNERKVPVMIHRAILGSMERFIGILTEEFAGFFPTWLAPVQVVIMNITDSQSDYVNELTQKLSNAGIRVKADLRNEKIGFKIREHTLRRVPYMLVCGDKEVESGKVAVRTRRGKDLGSMDVNEVIEKLQQEIRSRSLKQLEE